MGVMNRLLPLVTKGDLQGQQEQNTDANTEEARKEKITAIVTNWDFTVDLPVTNMLKCLTWHYELQSIATILIIASFIGRHLHR